MRSLLTATALAGLTLSPAAFAQDAEAPAQDAPGAYDASTVLATVDGTEITLGHLIVLRERLPQQYQQVPDDALFPGLLDQLIDQTLLANAEAAESEGDPLEVELMLANERRGALAAMNVQERVSEPLDEAALQAAYDEAVAGFEPQPEFNASHILVAEEEKARELLTEIEGGADFGEVASANSTDGSAANGGDLGWFGKGQMVPEFEAAVAELEPGSVGGPVQTQFGWHLVRLNETRQSEAPTLEEMRPELESQLRQQQVQEAIESLRAEAEIERPETGVPAAAIREDDLLDQ
jgi:peptidyl-prolyl cis-trans isomerase C